jgi:1-acyl-sn-glycerol-3-phosphate acyltransferase
VRVCVLLTVCICRTLWNKAFPGVNFRVLAATAALRVPLIREMWLWSYCIDASKPVARSALENRMNLLLYPGGEREQMMTVRGKHRLYLKDRKGFVKLAIESGAQLVPIYVFGETDLFEHSSLFLGARLTLMRKFGVAIPLIYGRAGLLPFATSVTAVVGPALTVQQKSNPSNADVDEAHSRYVSALEALFEENKAAFGYADAVLEIS